MDKEKELEYTSRIVKEILINCEKARDDDNLLYMLVVKRLNANALDKPFWEVMASLNELGLPMFETVRRTRQKIQAEFTDLKGSERVRSFRAINEEIFKEYARS